MERSTASQHADLDKPTFAEAARAFLHIGLTSFGGPAGQIALMHHVLVETRRWLDEKTYLLALNFCTLLPGPEAMQLATYAGWRLHGVAGGLMAGLLFVLPGAFVILALSTVYVRFGKLPLVETLFLGIKAAVLAIVVEALLRIARKSLSGPLSWAIAIASFLSIFVLKLPYPLIVLAAALAGFVMADRPSDTAVASQTAPPVPLTATLATAALWTAIWLGPLALLLAGVGSDHVLSRIGLFFAKLAVVTFGGAYAVLAYMAQDVVQTYGWLAPGEMLDGLGLAETTPGPLILVTEFVGFLSAYKQGGTDAFMLGLAGAVVTLWVTFAPSFLFIFTGAPYIERLQNQPRLRAALAAVTAAVVGVIFNLSLWFSLHVLFAVVDERAFGPLHVLIPQPHSLDARAAALAVAAAAMLFWARTGIMPTLAVSAGLSLLLARLI